MGLKYSDRTTKSFNYDNIHKFLTDFKSEIFNEPSLQMYNTLKNIKTIEEWYNKKDDIGLCFNEIGFVCTLFKDKIDIPFEKKDEFLEFILKSFLFYRVREETEEFVRGFHTIIPSDVCNILSGISLKNLDQLISGIKTIDVDEFLLNLKIEFLDTI